MEVVCSPEDTVACLKFSPEKIGSPEYLISGDWTNTVRCWMISEDGNAIPQIEGKHHCTSTGAVLDLDWHPNGNQVFVASTDGTASVWDLHSQQFMQIAKHDCPVKTIHYIAASHYQCAVTSSWDNTVKFWDLRSPNPCFNINLNASVYAGDIVYPMGAFALGNKKVAILNLEQTPSVYIEMKTPLSNCMSSSIKIFKDNSTQKPAGYMIGSITGYAGFCHLKPSDHSKNINFRCHRVNPITSPNVQETYPVSGIAVHPKNQNAFVTIGGDGHYAIWEKTIKGRINISEKYERPMTAVDINSSGTKLAFAIGYDWGKGHAFSEAKGHCKLFIKNWDSSMIVPDISTVPMTSL